MRIKDSWSASENDHGGDFLVCTGMEALVTELWRALNGHVITWTTNDASLDSDITKTKDELLI